MPTIEIHLPDDLPDESPFVAEFWRATNAWERRRVGGITAEGYADLSGEINAMTPEELAQERGRIDATIDAWKARKRTVARIAEQRMLDQEAESRAKSRRSGADSGEPM